MRIQQLEPVSSRLCLDIEKVCRTRLAIPAGARLLLAVSGGADSIALALIFHILAARLNVSLRAVHINHQLRPEADADADFASNFCREADIPCTVVTANIGELAYSLKRGLEETGRIMRQKIFEEQRIVQNADLIVTAHHAGDLGEDILMRLTRGAGWPGLGGMRWKSGYTVRPLLHTEPDRLRSLLITTGYSWREDKSNLSLEFMRNRFRHVVLPLLRCENPAIDRCLPRLHDLAAIDADYWEQELESALAKNPWSFSENRDGIELLLPAALLLPLHKAARLRLYYRALDQMRTFGQTRADTLQRLDLAWLNGVGGKALQCSGGIIAHCDKKGITFKKTQTRGDSKRESG